jgi:hypothetical protein
MLGVALTSKLSEISQLARRDDIRAPKPQYARSIGTFEVTGITAACDERVWDMMDDG